MMGAMAPLSDNHGDHLRKLAALVMQRRVQLDLTKQAAAKACRVAYQTYWNIEAGQGASGSTYAKIDVAFGLRAGSCQAVADGLSDSITLEDGTELIEGGQIRDFADRGQLAEAIDRAFMRSAQLTAPDLTLSQAKAIKDEMFRQLRSDGVLNSD